MKKLFLLIFILFYSYAILRYHLGKNIPWSEWYFIMNKAFAWTGFTLISFSVLQQKVLDKWKVSRRELGVQGFVFALFHAVSILFLFNQEHYPKFFDNGIINLMGWFILSIGFLSIIIFLFPLFTALQNLHSKSNIYKLGKVGVFLSVFHPFLIGYKDWFSLNDWPFYMPPITLIAVLTGIVIFMIRITSTKK